MMFSAASYLYVTPATLNSKGLINMFRKVLLISILFFFHTNVFSLETINENQCDIWEIGAKPAKSKNCLYLKTSSDWTTDIQSAVDTYQDILIGDNNKTEIVINRSIQLPKSGNVRLKGVIDGVNRPILVAGFEGYMISVKPPQLNQRVNNHNLMIEDLDFRNTSCIQQFKEVTSENGNKEQIADPYDGYTDLQCGILEVSGFQARYKNNLFTAPYGICLFHRTDSGTNAIALENHYEGNEFNDCGYGVFSDLYTDVYGTEIERHGISTRRGNTTCAGKYCLKPTDQFFTHNTFICEANQTCIELNALAGSSFKYNTFNIKAHSRGVVLADSSLVTFSENTIRNDLDSNEYFLKLLAGNSVNQITQNKIQGYPNILLMQGGGKVGIYNTRGNQSAIIQSDGTATSSSDIALTCGSLIIWSRYHSYSGATQETCQNIHVFK